MIGALRSLERFLLPNACVCCEAPVSPLDPDALVCAVCRHRMRQLSGGCGRCRQPLPPVGPCRFCRGWPRALDRVRSAVWLDDEAREILHHLKYDGYAALGETVAELVTRTVPEPRGACLLPVPLSPRRYRARGFNQAAVIAAALARRWHLPLTEHLLERVRDTPSQTALSPEQRAANVRHAFNARPCPGGRREKMERRERLGKRASAPPASPGTEWGGATIILVDDVLTTGATLAAAAEALAAAGWTAVGAVTFARARPFAQRVVLEWDPNQQLTQRG